MLFDEVPAQFKNWTIFSLFLSILIYSGCKSFIRYMLYKYFLSVSGLSFYPKSVFQRTEVLILMKFNLSIFLFYDNEKEGLREGEWY